MSTDCEMMELVWAHTYFVRDSFYDSRGVVRLEALLEKWEIASDLVKVFGVNFSLSWCAAREQWSVRHDLWTSLGLQVPGVVSRLLVLTSPCHLGGRRGAGSPNGHNDVEIDERVGDAAHPPGLVFDLRSLLRGEAGSIVVCINRCSALSMHSGHTLQRCSRASSWFDEKRVEGGRTPDQVDLRSNMGVASNRVFTAPLTATGHLSAMSHICYEGGCASGPKRHMFSSIRGLRQHQYKCHQDTPEEEMSLGNARTLKRKRDAEDEEERKRQQLEAQLAFEAANREPEPQPVWPTNRFF